MDEVAQAEREAEALIAKVRSLRRPLTEDERRAVGARARALRPIIAAAHERAMIEGRPEVVSRGAPVSGIGAQRGQEEARRRLAARVRAKGAACVECPAASAHRTGGDELLVVCGVELSELSSRTDPQSLLTFCAGDYKACTSWIAEREAQRAGRKHALVGA